MDQGPCKAAIPRWYFDNNYNQCKDFLFGGCRGNANNFVSAKKCEVICRNTDVQGFDIESVKIMLEADRNLSLYYYIIQNDFILL